MARALALATLRTLATTTSPTRATSLAAALKLAPSGALAAIDLAAADDCVCVNLMCERVGDACVCRVAAGLEKVARRGGSASVRSLSLAGNRLPSLPPSIGELSALTDLDVSHNELTALPAADVWRRLPRLRRVRLDRNARLTDLTPLAAAEGLVEVVVDGAASRAAAEVGGGRWRVRVVV